jgi:hypothetical protein
MSIKVNGQPARLEDHANVRDMPVVDNLQAGGVGGGMPEIPAAVAERQVGESADGQKSLVRGVASPNDVPAQ